MLFFSLSFLGLIGSEHFCHLLEIWFGSVLLFSRFSTLLHNDIIYYKHKTTFLSRVLLKFFDFLRFYPIKRGIIGLFYNDVMSSNEIFKFLDWVLRISFMISIILEVNAFLSKHKSFNSLMTGLL